MCEPWEAFFVGLIGALLTVPTDALLNKLKIDDPVGVIPVHFVCVVWSLLAVGKILISYLHNDPNLIRTIGWFITDTDSTIEGQQGLFRTGQGYLLGIQAAAVAIICVWTLVTPSLFLVMSPSFKSPDKAIEYFCS
jgi:ammonia channel protein AmtB